MCILRRGGAEEFEGGLAKGRPNAGADVRKRLEIFLLFDRCARQRVVLDQLTMGDRPLGQSECWYKISDVESKKNIKQRKFTIIYCTS